MNQATRELYLYIALDKERLMRAYLFAPAPRDCESPEYSAGLLREWVTDYLWASIPDETRALVGGLADEVDWVQIVNALHC